MCKIAAVIILCVVFVAMAEPEIKGSHAELLAYLKKAAPEVTINGKATLKIQADKAQVSLNVRTEDKSLKKALVTNQEIRSRLVGELSNAKIPEKSIVMSKFSSTPQYGLFGSEAKSYKVDNQIFVNVQTEGQFQKVAGIVDSVEQVSYQGVSFEPARKEAVKDSLLWVAYDDALRKAKRYESKFGVTLKVRSFREIGGEIPQPFRRQAKRSASMEETAIATYEPVSQFDEVELSQRVLVTFEVHAKAK